MDRYGEADPLGESYHRAVDADDVPFEVHERSAAVSRVDARVCLDHALVQEIGARQGSSDRADHAHGYGRRARQTQGVPDGEDDLTYPEVLRVAQLRCLQVGRLHAHQRHIGLAVGPDDLTGKGAAVPERDLDPLRPLDYVVVGDDVSLLLVYDY